MNRFQANLCLLTTTMCWAPEVVLMKRFPAGVPALAVITLSTALGAAILLLVLFAHVRVRPTRGFLCWAALLGLLTAVQSTLAVLGSRQLPVSTSMFLLSLYVVGVPVVMVIIRPFRRWRGQPLEPAPAPRTWAGVALIMVGLALAVQLGSGSAQLVPIAILLVSVALLSLYLVGVNNASRRYDPAQMIVYVLGFASVFALGGWLLVDPGSLPAVDLSADFVAVLAMYSIFVIALAGGVAFFAYPYVTPTNVAAVYSLQVVFAIGLAAVLPSLLVQRLRLTAGIVAGCLLVVVGVLVAEVDLLGMLRRRVGRGVPE